MKYPESKYIELAELRKQFRLLSATPKGRHSAECLFLQRRIAEMASDLLSDVSPELHREMQGDGVNPKFLKKAVAWARRKSATSAPARCWLLMLGKNADFF